MAASKVADPRAEQAPLAVSDAEAKKKAQVLRLLLANIGQSVLQHVINLQSEIALISAACNGDVAETARNMTATSTLAGLVGLLFNQIGGKLSDAVGRKPFLLAGPVSNLLIGLLVYARPKNLRLLFITRILKFIGTTFSGTVMTGASTVDLLQDEKGPIVDQYNAKVPVVVGIAVVVGPFLESLVQKLSGGRAHMTYLALSAIAAVQLLQNAFQVPETLPPAKRISMSEVTASIASINPFAFLKIYTSNNAMLKKVVTITTLQNFLDGRCTSDVFQMWARNNLKWPLETIRNYVSLWGGCSVASGVLQMIIASKLSLWTYTVFTSLCVGSALTIQGLKPRGIYMWAALPVVLPGVNAGTALMLKRVQMNVAVSSGVGQGEFSAWVNNMRGLATALAPWIYGQWYAFCEKNGLYSGTVWPLAGFAGAILPLAIFCTSSNAAYEEAGRPTEPEGPEGKKP